MKKINWENVLQYIAMICFSIIIAFGLYSFAIMLVGMADGYEFCLKIALVGFTVVGISTLIFITNGIIEYICYRRNTMEVCTNKPNTRITVKKQNKLGGTKYEKQFAENDIVV